jgi:EpsI family protein
MRSSLPPFLSAALLLAACAIYLRAHSSNEVFPSRLPLQTFPEHLGDFTGTDVPIEGDVLQILGPGDFLSRVYTGQSHYIHLFIAYFPTQRAGDTIHSPRNCLPGAGWTPVESTQITLSVPGLARFPANRYVIAKGDSRQLVLYWYWAHDRGVASEYWAKYYLVADSIRMNRSDGSLVRLTTPIAAGESADAAEQRLMPVVNEIVPQLENYIPR